MQIYSEERELREAMERVLRMKIFLPKKMCFSYWRQGSNVLQHHDSEEKKSG